MANSKGTNVVTLRKLVRAKGNGCEQRILARLSGEDARLYQAALALSWVPVEGLGRIFQVCAEELYPSDPEGLRRIGEQIARDNLGGVYRVLLRLATTQYALSQIGKLWKTYNDTGEVEIEYPEGESSVVIHVNRYPGLPRAYLEETAGYMIGTGRLCGAKNVSVQAEQRPPDSNRWKITWS